MSNNNKDDKRFKQTHIYFTCQEWFRDLVKEKAKRAGKDTMSVYIRELIMDRWEEDQVSGEKMPWDKVTD